MPEARGQYQVNKKSDLIYSCAFCHLNYKTVEAQLQPHGGIHELLKK